MTNSLEKTYYLKGNLIKHPPSPAHKSGIKNLFKSHQMHFSPKGFNFAIKAYAVQENWLKKISPPFVKKRFLNVHILQDSGSEDVIRLKIKDVLRTFNLLQRDITAIKTKTMLLEEILEVQRKQTILCNLEYRVKRIQYKTDKLFATSLLRTDDYDDDAYVFNKNNGFATGLRVRDYKQLVYESLCFNNNMNEELIPLAHIVTIGQNKFAIQRSLKGKIIFILLKFEDSTRLGTGGRGIVHRVVELKKAKFMAMKFPLKANRGLTNLQNEAQKLVYLQANENHEGIQKKPVAILHTLIKDVQGNQTPQVAGICGPLYDFDLENAVSEHQIHVNWSLLTLMEGCRQLLSGLAFLHANQMVHRDIKPYNILINQGKKIRFDISDFGSVKSVGDLEDYFNLLSSNALGDTITEEYIPRVDELHIQQSYDSLVIDWYMTTKNIKLGYYFQLLQKLDVYQLGVVLFYLLTGTEPYEKVSQRPVPDDFSIAKKAIEANFAHPEVRRELLFFFSGMLAIDPDRRFSAKAALFRWNSIYLKLLDQEINDKV